MKHNISELIGRAMEELGGVDQLKAIFVQRVRAALRVKDWTLDKLAVESNVSVANVYAFEGRSEIPTLAELNRMMWALGLVFDDVMAYPTGSLPAESVAYWKGVSETIRPFVMNRGDGREPEELESDIDFVVRTIALRGICRATPELTEDVRRQRDAIRARYANVISRDR